MIQLKEEVIAELVSLEIPGAQKLLRAGFKQVTALEMRSRFGCDLIQERENKRTLEEFKKRVPEKYHHKIETNTFGDGCCRHEASYWFDNYKFSRPSKECILQIDEYKHYINEVIPDRVIESAQIAKRLGAKNLSVVYPMLNEIPKKDPILIELLESDRYIEIDYWE